MMKSSSSFLAAFASLHFVWGDVALGFTASRKNNCRRHLPVPATTALFNLAGSDTELESSYFQMQQIPTATSGEKLDHIVECSENGECDIEDMMNMIDELEELNAQCQGTMSRECNLDAVAARNVLKVALASKVAVEDALSREDCAAPSSSTERAEEDEDPYASLAEMEDECYMQQQIPSETTSPGTVMRLDRIVECAEGTSGADACDIEEMLEMVEELEKLNLECEGALSRECSLDAVAARNILKVALASRAMP
eukprot:CAMPEP_0183719582 /NCGR_PEP_ID=MMETSP0737-20130205/12449_1 /TAXON_ID=385413 /ORGANISM="Thalassiosira miniscula, Strain CCMP1093" /LENGTH=254 /DNA_ID=CAMNT_0025949303 /DNA_START=538 /DNA_END=1302 /DNA_ORIENTATION=+